MLNQINKISLFLIICICTLIGPVFPQNTFNFKGKRSKESITFNKSRGLIIITTYINNKGPFNFVLDSGVGLMLITDPALRDSLQLKYVRKIIIKGLGEGKDLDAYTTSFLKVKIGSAVAESMSAAILDEDIFNLSGYAGIPIHGLIGNDFFESFVVRVFYDAGYLNIYNHRKSRLIRKGLRIPISIEQNKPYVNVLVDVGDQKKMSLKMLIDTGAGLPISLETYKDEAFPLPDKFFLANLGVGLGGNIGGFIGRIDNLRIGKFDIKKPLSSFPFYEDAAAKVTSVPRNGTIGNQLLKKFEIIFDYEKKCIYVRPNVEFKIPIEHDMSGMELVSAGDDFNRYFVNRVEPWSAADEFGILKDDELVGINFKPVSQMSFNEISELFRSKDGRTLFIEIRRKEETYRGVLTLKRRI